MSDPPLRLRPTDLRFDPPALDDAAVAAIVREHYGLAGTLSPLRGERDHNTLVTAPDGARYVLKVASPSEPIETTDFQCAALDHIAAVDPALPVPRVVPTVGGHWHARVAVGGGSTAVRMLTYLPGITFDDVGPMAPLSLRAIGAFQGRLARALRWFRHPAASNFVAWDLAGGLVGDDALWEDLSPMSAAVVEPCRERVERATGALAGRRAQIVHNDGHRGNLLRRDDQHVEVVGVIDFGDLVRTAVVADLAICAASFIQCQPDPPEALGALAAGYHEWTELLDEDIELLADLTLARLVLSTLLVEYQARHTPHIADLVRAELPTLLATACAWQRHDATQVTDRVRSGLGRTHP